MKRLSILTAALLLLLLAAPAGADQRPSWRVVCDEDVSAFEPLCHVALFTQDEANGTWLGVAVQVLNGSHEIQVISAGDSYSSAEIDVSRDTITVTDYCYGSYCVFVHAEDLIKQFKSGQTARVRLYNGAPSAMVERQVSLRGFTKAYEDYLERIEN